MRFSGLTFAFLLIAATVFGSVMVPRDVEAAYVGTGTPCMAGITSPCPRLFEGFENQTFPSNPGTTDTPQFYTFSSSGVGSSFIDTTLPQAGLQYLKSTASGGGTNSFQATFDLATNLCLGNGPGGGRQVDFWLKLPSLGNGASMQVQFIEGTGGGTDGNGFTGIGISKDGSGISTFSSFHNPDGSTTTITSGVGLVVDNTWHKYGITCSATAGTAILVYYDGPTSTPITDSASAYNPTKLRINMQCNVGGCPAMYLDSINFGEPPAVVQTTPNGPELTVVDLNGMDVDRTGTTLIIRTNDAAGNKDNVRTYNAQTLSTPGNVLDSECNRLEGVSALENYVVYFECDSGDEDDVDNLAIRNANLGPPQFPEPPCGGILEFCVADIDANELADCQGAADSSPDDCDGNDFQLHITRMDEVPFDYSAQCDGEFFGTPASRLDGENCGSRDAVYFAWGASFEDGYVGVITYVMNRGADDTSNTIRVGVGPTSTTIDQICTVQDSDGISYLYATESAAQAKGFRLDFDIIAGSQVTRTFLETDMIPVFPGTAQTAGAVGIACGEERFATIQANGFLCVFERLENGGSNAPLFCRTVSSVPSAGVAMSGTGEYVAWVEASTLRIACVIETGCPATAIREAVPLGGLVAQAPIPTGTFKHIAMDANANSVWIGTDVRVRHYNAVYQATTGEATACAPGDVGCGPTPTGGPSPTGGAGDGGDGVFGFGTTGNIIAAIATVVGFLLLAFAMTSRRKTGKDGDE